MINHSNRLVALMISIGLAGCNTTTKQADVPDNNQKEVVSVSSLLIYSDIDPFISISQMTNKDVRELLVQMHKADQQYRDSINNAGRPDRDALYIKKMVANDEANLKILAKIINKFGWPEIDRFGEDAAETAWLIIWHHRDNREVLCKYFDLMQQAVAKSQMNKNSFSLIQEQILMLPVDQVNN